MNTICTIYSLCGRNLLFERENMSHFEQVYMVRFFLSRIVFLGFKTKQLVITPKVFFLLPRNKHFLIFTPLQASPVVVHAFNCILTKNSTRFFLKAIIVRLQKNTESGWNFILCREEKSLLVFQKYTGCTNSHAHFLKKKRERERIVKHTVYKHQWFTK